MRNLLKVLLLGTVLVSADAFGQSVTGYWMPSQISKGGASAPTVSAPAAPASTVSTPVMKTGEELFNSLSKAEQDALYSGFSNANMTAKDLTPDILDAWRNGESLTSAAAKHATNAAETTKTVADGADKVYGEGFTKAMSDMEAKWSGNIAGLSAKEFSNWAAQRSTEVAKEITDAASEGLFNFGTYADNVGNMTASMNMLAADLGFKDAAGNILTGDAFTKALTDQGYGNLANALKNADSLTQAGGLFGSGAEISTVADLGPLALRDAVQAKLANDIAQQLTKEATENGTKTLTDAQAKAIEQQAKEAAAKQVAEMLPIKVLTQNVVQYALVIAEALKGNEIDDATKEVRVKGADPMQESQGAQGGGASTASGSAMMATTISGSANALIALLDAAKIDLGLLSTDIDKPEQQEAKGSVSASAGKSGADVGASGQAASETLEEDLTTDDEREIMHRRALLLGEWATAATQIGEGSNAISHAFYDRAQAFAMMANAAQGTLGGITAISDTDRFVLFEITRGAALSAIQLGLQGAANLNSLEEVAKATETTTAKASVSAGGAKSQ